MPFRSDDACSLIRCRHTKERSFILRLPTIQRSKPIQGVLNRDDTWSSSRQDQEDNQNKVDLGKRGEDAKGFCCKVFKRIYFKLHRKDSLEERR